MLEVIAFVAFGLALAALLNGRKTAERLDGEIAALKEQVAQLEAVRPVAPAASASCAAT